MSSASSIVGGTPLAAHAPVVHPEMSGGDLLGRIQGGVDETIAGPPVAQIAGQEHRRLAVQIDEPGWHALSAQANGKIAP